MNEPEPEDLIADLRRENLKSVREDPLIRFAYWRGLIHGSLLIIVIALLAILGHVTGIIP